MKILFFICFLTVFPFGNAQASFPINYSEYPEYTIEESHSVITPNFVRDVKFCWIGFVLGLFLNIVGVGIAYLLSKNHHLRKSSWYGLAALGLIVLSLFSSNVITF